MYAPRHAVRACWFRVTLIVTLSASCVFLLSCKEHKGPTKAQKAQAKSEKDQELLALPYPKSSGGLPKSIVITYDAAGDRSTMTWTTSNLRVLGPASANVASITLHCSSSYKGTSRSADRPEGSVDARVVARCSSPGLLSYAGSPGAILIASESRPLKPASGKGAYSSTKSGAAWDESVSFRVSTADLVAAANALNATLKIGSVDLEVAGDAMTELREFVARMNPRP